MLTRKKHLVFLVYIFAFLLPIFTLVISLPANWPPVTIALEVLDALVVLFLIFVRLSDPTMEELMEKRKCGFRPGPYQPKDGQHVIHNRRCRICFIDAPQGTKHCRRCNECIEGFDHHCIWLDKCVGSKNYRLFIALTFFVFLTTFAHSIMHLCLLVLWTRNDLAMDQQFLDTFLFPVPIMVWGPLFAFFSIMSVLISGSLFHLLWFHVTLWKRGKSTYQYMREQRKVRQVGDSSGFTSSMNTVSANV